MSLRRTISGLPLLGDLAEARRLLRARRATGFVMESTPGHFGSPIPALKEIRSREAQVFAVPGSVPGVDLRGDAQLALVRRLAAFAADQPFTAQETPGRRYWFENSLFSYGDGLVLHCLLRHLRPRRLVEVGSGFSSAVILDTDELFGDGSLSCTFIDPFPQRLRGLLRPEDDRRHEVVTQFVQQVPLSLFEELGADDVLFIDSSHVSKVGSDVNHLLFEVLPRLAPGVVVHVHDVFYPFEYPREWIYQGRAWNENYLLRAFLMFNAAFEIEIFNSYLAQFHAEEMAASMPLWAKKPGGSLWLRRVGT